MQSSKNNNTGENHEISLRFKFVGTSLKRDLAPGQYLLPDEVENRAPMILAILHLDLRQLVLALRLVAPRNLPTLRS